MTNIMHELLVQVYGRGCSGQSILMIKIKKLLKEDKNNYIIEDCQNEHCFMVKWIGGNE